MSENRVVTLVEALERDLIAFVNRYEVTHEEYRAAIDLIIDEVKAGEESLLFDVFLEAETTKIDNLGRIGSKEAIEGPFYLEGAPMLEGPRHIMPQRPDEAGEPLVFSGSVVTTAGRPVVGAELDIWHADAAGQYSQIHPGIPDWNLRGRFLTDDAGRFEVQTILPPPYEIPKDGPTGIVLNVLGRQFFRPAHLHVKVRHPEFGEMTSQLYFEGGEYLDGDVANAVRDDLVLKATLNDVPDDIRARGLDRPFHEAAYEFVLPEISAS